MRALLRDGRPVPDDVEIVSQSGSGQDLAWVDSGWERVHYVDESEIVSNGKPHLPRESSVVSEVSTLPTALRDPGGKSGCKMAPMKSGAEVRAAEFSEVERLSLLGEPCIGRETSTLLYSFPKTGKTTLMEAAVSDFRRDGLSVAIFTEEAERLWHERLESAGPEWDDVQFVNAMNVDSAVMLERLREGCPQEVIVVDTIRAVFGIRDENDNGEVHRKAAPWLAATRDLGKTLICLAHENKAGGSHGRGISGAHALFGAFDTAIEIQRVVGQKYRREVKGWGRLFDPPEFTYELTHDGRLVSLGTSTALERKEVASRASEAVEGDWRTRNEILEAIGDPSPSTEGLRSALGDLVRDGILERDPAADRKGATYKWRKPHLPRGSSKGGKSGSDVVQ